LSVVLVNVITVSFAKRCYLRKSSVADWQRAIRRLFEIADVTGHPHMFRHTFATDLLSRGIPIEDVSILLGHKSVRITEAYYSHWVKARRIGWSSGCGSCGNRVLAVARRPDN
jgi:integrase